VLGVLGLVVSSQAAEGTAPSKKQLNRVEADAFFTNGTIVHLAFEIEPEAMESLRKTPDEYVRVLMREGQIVHSNVAVHLKGGSGSFRKVDDRPGLTLDFNRYEPGGRFHGLKKLHLNNGAQDPTRLSEYIGGQLFREAGVPASRAAHALVELNGRPLGLYVALEAMNKDFFSQYFKEIGGNLYGQTRSCDVTNEIERMEGDAPLTYADLKGLAAAVLEPEPAIRLEKIRQTLDVERFISFMAMEVLLAHWDGYTYNRHNYRIYQDLDTDRMAFFPHDLDQLMKRSNLGFMVTPRGLVAQAVMNTPELRTRYLERICFLATNLFVVPRLTNRIDRGVAAVLPTIQAYDPELAAAFTNNALEFKDRIAARGRYLHRQFGILAGTIPPLAFRKDAAPLSGWQPEGFPAVTKLARIKTEERKPALWVKLEGTNSPAYGIWRTQVLLDPGWYRFEGLGRCAGVMSFRRRREGMALFPPMYAYRRQEPYRLSGDLTWQKLGMEFEVTTREDVDLVCELRADKGEAWFAEDSLQLVRLSAPSTVSLADSRRGVPTSVAEKAAAAVKAASALAIKDTNRPAFHFRPPAQWMNDVCGMVYYQGRYHVFFQFNPWSDQWGPGTGWGHARSRDLVRWEYLPPILLPDAQNGSTLDGSGSAMLDGYGNPILFYTHTPEGYPKNKRQQWAAMPEDELLTRWRRVNIGLVPGQSGVPSGISPNWADMFAFKAGGRTFATFKSSGGLVCEALNPGLTQWKAAGKIPDVTGECPNLFSLDERYVLLQSTYPLSYRVGDFDTNKVTFRSRDKKARILDYGPDKKEAADSRGLYGTTVFTDTKDRVVLLGWIGGFKTNRGWNGVMSLPRVLHLEGDQLRQEPLPELALLRTTRPMLLKDFALTNAARILETVRGDMVEVVVAIKPGTARAYGMRLRTAPPPVVRRPVPPPSKRNPLQRPPEPPPPEPVPPDPGAVVIRQSLLGLNVAGREIPYIPPAGQAFKCRLFFDKSVLEAFIEDGRCVVSRVVYPPTSDLRVEVFAEDGTIQVEQLEAWNLRPYVY
jgi:sucrose-6-phosphate hydrolase SacC (GH32 family)